MNMACRVYTLSQSAHLCGFFQSQNCRHSIVKFLLGKGCQQIDYYAYNPSSSF